METILAVDDSIMNLKAIKRLLSAKYKVVAVSSAKDGFTYLENHRPDLILLDILMPTMDGFEMMEIMRNDEKYRSIPVIFLTADNNKNNEIKGFLMGAMDFIAKPFEPDIVMSRIAKALELDSLRRYLEEQVANKTKELEVMQEYANEAREVANKDVLTGLWNRRYMEKVVDEYLNNDGTGAIFMIDIDDFKGVNDSFGHILGDEVLIGIAKTIKNCIGEDDIGCRIGGDEFIVFLKDMVDMDEISNLAKTILSELNSNIKYPDTSKSLGASIGIAISQNDGRNFETLYANADKALYHTKNNGKNGFHFYSKESNREIEQDSTEEDLDYIRKILTEESIVGTYMVEYEGFKNIAQFVKRNVERNGKKYAYILFTIESKDDLYISSEKINLLMKQLEESIKSMLRISDVTTRYSHKQMIAILIDIDIEMAENVAERVKNDFYSRTEGCNLNLRVDIQKI